MHDLQNELVRMRKSDLVVEIYPKLLNSTRAWDDLTIW